MKVACMGCVLPPKRDEFIDGRPAVRRVVEDSGAEIACLKVPENGGRSKARRMSGPLADSRRLVTGLCNPRSTGLPGPATRFAPNCASVSPGLIVTPPALDGGEPARLPEPEG